MVATALEYADGSAALIAMMLARLLLALAGAVHKPVLEMLPALAVQFTAVLLVPFTVA
jgi:hypothetical protein